MRRLSAWLIASHMFVAAAVILFVASDLPTPVLVATAIGGVAVGLATGLGVARAVTAPLDSVRSALGRVAREQAADAPQRGPTEVRDIAAVVGRTADALTARIEALRRDIAVRDQILSGLSEGVVLAEPDGRVVYANAVATRLLGGAAMPPELRGTGTTEYVVHHPKRQEIRAIGSRIDDGRLVVVLQDLTEARRVEAMRRDFVADASHEMKTPVAAILATAETMEAALDDDPAMVRRSVATVISEARRLAELINDLLDLARLERAEPPPVRVALTEITLVESGRAQAAADAKGLSLTVRTEASIAVRGDASEIELAIRNLLDNAVRYTAEGKIEVDLRRVDDRAVLTVADTGSGIPSRELPRIFERFYRVDRARARGTGGTGLGLAIVKHVVERHGGTITAESELGSGSRFTVELPTLVT